MEKGTALKIILAISILGMAFSGYLSYQEVIRQQCLYGCSKLGGIPVCVYGFVMYLSVFAVAILGLRGKVRHS